MNLRFINDVSAKIKTSRSDMVEKAINLMAKITHCQPFEDGNRRTGIVSATKFLQDNGYDIDIESGQANLDMRKILKEIKMHSRTLHVETMNQLSFYISKRIKPYEPTG